MKLHVEYGNGTVEDHEFEGAIEDRPGFGGFHDDLIIFESRAKQVVLSRREILSYTIVRDTEEIERVEADELDERLKGLERQQEHLEQLVRDAQRPVQNFFDAAAKPTGIIVDRRKRSWRQLWRKPDVGRVAIPLNDY